MSKHQTTRTHVLNHFRWIDGHADTWTMLRDAEGLREISEALAELLRDEQIDVIDWHRGARIRSRANGGSSARCRFLAGTKERCAVPG